MRVIFRFFGLALAVSFVPAVLVGLDHWVAAMAVAVAASAIYRAAEMMQLAKKPDEVGALVKRLETGYPESEWTVKARLLGGDVP